MRYAFLKITLLGCILASAMLGGCAGTSLIGPVYSTTYIYKNDQAADQYYWQQPTPDTTQTWGVSGSWDNGWRRHEDTKVVVVKQPSVVVHPTDPRPPIRPQPNPQPRPQPQPRPNPSTHPSAR